jgi:hypothetical protein
MHNSKLCSFIFSHELRGFELQAPDGHVTAFSSSDHSVVHRRRTHSRPAGGRQAIYRGYSQDRLLASASIFEMLTINPKMQLLSQIVSLRNALKRGSLSDRLCIWDGVSR